MTRQPFREHVTSGWLDITDIAYGSFEIRPGVTSSVHRLRAGLPDATGGPKRGLTSVSQPDTLSVRAGGLAAAVANHINLSRENLVRWDLERLRAEAEDRTGRRGGAGDSGVFYDQIHSLEWLFYDQVFAMFQKLFQ